MPGKFNLDDYVTVNTRIAGFYEKWPEGAIRTVLLSEPGAKTVVFRAEAYRDYHDVENPVSVGHAHEIEGVGMVNQTSAMENCETSAVGRALAMAGFEVTKGVASREEMAAAERRMEYTNAAKPQTPQNFSPKSGSQPAPAAPPAGGGDIASKQSVNALIRLMQQKGIIPPYAAYDTPEGKFRAEKMREFTEIQVGKRDSRTLTDRDVADMTDFLTDLPDREYGRSLTDGATEVRDGDSA